LDPSNTADFEALRDSVDTVVCLNVLEYVDDPSRTVGAIAETLQPDGALLVLVPQGPNLFGSIDRTLGHKRRFRRAELQGILEASGFEVIRWMQLNKVSTPAWWIYGRLLKSHNISKVTMKVFDKTVWLWRRLEWALPWSGLSLIAVARRSGSRKLTGP
jgi:SAM-dependent methyltransferase